VAVPQNPFAVALARIAQPGRIVPLLLIAIAIVAVAGGVSWPGIAVLALIGTAALFVYRDAGERRRDARELERLHDQLADTARHAQRFGEGLKAAGFRVLNDIVLNQVLVSFGDAETTERVVAAIQRDGTCWCGTTTWQGETAMRISVSSWATTGDDVEKSLEAMIRAAR